MEHTLSVLAGSLRATSLSMEFRQKLKHSGLGSSEIQVRSRNSILLYFFGYKMQVFHFQNNPKNLDPSSKMDLDFWDCFRMDKLDLKAGF